MDEKLVSPIKWLTAAEVLELYPAAPVDAAPYTIEVEHVSTKSLSLPEWIVTCLEADKDDMAAAFAAHGLKPRIDGI